MGLAESIREQAAGREEQDEAILIDQRIRRVALSEEAAGDQVTQEEENRGGALSPSASSQEVLETCNYGS